MLSDLTSSFSNSTSSMINDFVLLTTDKYDKDYIDEYDLSGVASVGYIDQDQAVISRSDAYKVLLCAGDSTNCDVGMFDRSEAKDIFKKVSDGGTAQDVISLVKSDKKYRYGGTAWETDNSSILVKSNKVLLNSDGEEVKDSENKKVNLKTVIKNSIKKLKTKPYAKVWDPTSCDTSILPAALAYARENEYSCVVYYTFRIDKNERGPSITFYGPNADSLTELAKTTHKDYGKSLEKLDCLDGSVVNATYDEELSKAAKKLNINVIVVNVCTVSSDTDTDIKDKLPSGNPGFNFNDNSKKLKLTKNNFNKYTNDSGAFTFYSQMAKLLDALIKSAYEGVIPSADEIAENNQNQVCHHDGTDLIEEFKNKIKDLGLDGTPTPGNGATTTPLFLKYEDKKNTTMFFKAGDNLKFKGNKKPDKKKKCDVCKTTIYTVEVKTSDIEYKVKFTYLGNNYEGTIKITSQ